MIRFGDIHKARKRWVYRLVQKLTGRARRPGFDPANARTLLFLRDNNKLGDLIVSTPVFRAACQAGFEVSIVATPGNAGVLVNNPHIRHVYLHDGSLWSMLKLALRLRAMRFDVLVDFLDWQPDARAALLANLIGARHTIGFDHPHCDVSLDGCRGQSLHASTRNAKVLDCLGIQAPAPGPRYDLHLTDTSERGVQAFLASLPHRRTLLLNPCGRCQDRRMSPAQIRAIVDWSQTVPGGCNVVINGETADLEQIDAPGAFLTPFSDFDSAQALVKHADFVCSIDTSIIHVAAAFDKPVVILYQRDRDPVFRNSRIWGPNNPHAQAVFAEDHRLYAIEPQRITEALSALLAQSAPETLSGSPSPLLPIHS